MDYYIYHRLTLNGVEREHYFAFTRLVKKHPNKHNLGCLNKLPMWDATNFEKIRPASFLPVHLIHSLFTRTTLSADIVKLMVVCPIPRRANVYIISKLNTELLRAPWSIYFRFLKLVFEAGTTLRVTVVSPPF